MFSRPVALVALSALSIALATGCGGGDVSADDGSGESFDQAMRARTDADVRAEIEAAAAGQTYMSESDYPFTFVSAPLGPSEKTITEALVRAKLASFVDHEKDADKPLAKLFAQSGTFADWVKSDKECTSAQEATPGDCAKRLALDDALGRNLRGIKVYYFGASGKPGHVDGTGVTVFVVGRTPQGNLAGIQTIAIWT